MKPFGPSCCRASSISPALGLAISLEKSLCLLREAEDDIMGKGRIRSACQALYTELAKVMTDEEMNGARKG